MGILDFLGFGKAKPRNKISKAKATKQKQLQKLRRKSKFKLDKGSKLSSTTYKIGDLCEVSSRRHCSDDYIISISDLPIEADKVLGTKAFKGTKAINDLILDVKQSLKLLDTMYNRNTLVQITGNLTDDVFYNKDQVVSLTVNHFLRVSDLDDTVKDFKNKLINHIVNNGTSISVKEFDFTVKEPV